MRLGSLILTIVGGMRILYLLQRVKDEGKFYE